MTSVVGTYAARFDLQAAMPDFRKTRIRTGDYRGRWLAMVFYPRDFSFVCPTELTAFSAEKVRFDERDCALLGISIDSVESHLEWLKTPAVDGGVEGLQFPLAADPRGHLCRSFGIWREDVGLPNRGLFIIDPNGVLRYAASYDLSVGRNVEDVLRSLDAIQAGGLCPSNWRRADGVLDVASLLQPGRVLGHYRIERELGRGAFGRVIEAKDLRLQRSVALKVISKPGLKTEVELLNEARTAAIVNHPNVCTVYSADSIDTLPTIVMELVDGPSLSNIIADNFSQVSFRKIARQIASGLAAAHEMGVIHGDLKPANILLRRNGDPVIVDFGLARSLSRTKKSDKLREQTPSQTDIALDTAESNRPEETLMLRPDELHPSDAVISGTPAYMSPEQASGGGVGEASDIFSLGLVFVEMLCGSPPFGNMSAIEIITALRRREFVESLVDKIPIAYREHLAALLAMDACNRPNAADVCGCLDS